ncbi:MAG: peptidoglycan bridge formation glycyltransferase FemA/FemB family protein [Candidatus Gracilibacteria bacterium]|nr:peptidoglycan bridge formation glycyltransferase FemA/FemB family protein [Candidatus Gracilibacteria bacterium]
MNHTKNHISGSFWQSEGWKNILTTSGQALRVEQFSHKDQVIYIEFRSIGLGQVGAFSLGVHSSLADEGFYHDGCTLAKKYKAIFWQIEYCDAEMVRNIPGKSSTPYKYFLEPYTRVLDLTQDENMILSQMHEKGRYNIRLAEKRGVKVQWVESHSENIAIWMSLLADTTSRDGFAHNSQKYYESFLACPEARLAFAFYEEKVIAAGIFVYHGTDAIYYYGASSSDKEVRKHMAPYLLQWFAILEGKKHGCIQYDFLGIAKPGEIDGHLAGVTSFKEKFGGEIKELGPKFLIPLSLKYHFFILARKIKNRSL